MFEKPNLDPEELEDLNITVRHQAAQKSTWISVVVNLILTAIQMITGWLTHSQALIADGVHSLSDLIADFVVLLANKHSQKEADHDHHYGHHRYENAASLMLGGLLFIVGLGMLWSAFGKIHNHEALPTVHVYALYVAGATLLAKEILFRYMLKIAEQVRSSLLVANAWHARSDAASSLVVAIGIIGNLLGYPILDPIAALIVGLMVTKMGARFAWNSLHDLMDRAATKEEIVQIQSVILKTPGVLGLHGLCTRKVGDWILVDVHLEIDGEKTVKEGHDIAVLARQRVMDRYSVLNVTTHVDPVDVHQSIQNH